MRQWLGNANPYNCDLEYVDSKTEDVLGLVIGTSLNQQGYRPIVMMKPSGGKDLGICPKLETAKRAVEMWWEIQDEKKRIEFAK